MTYFPLFLVILSGLCWTLTYYYSIRIGLRDKATVMPFLALALNITWEALYAVVGLTGSLTNIQAWINIVWVMFDVVLLYIYFKVGRDEFPAPKKYFIPWSIFGLFMALVLQIAFLKGFDVYDLSQVNLGVFLNSILDPHLGCWYSAFIQNLVMSFLYIAMFIRRRGNKGQGLMVAITKCIGTFAPTILFGIILGNNVVLTIGLFIFVLDLLYIWLLTKGEAFFKVT